LLAYRFDGDQAAGFPRDLGNGSTFCSPTVADLNGDGSQEIVLYTQIDSLYVVQQDGSDYPGFPIRFASDVNSVPSSSPAVGDFDQDGELEIAAVSNLSGTGAEIFIFDTDIDGGTSGLPLSGWPVPVPGGSEASPVVGDIDGDGVPDLLHGIGGSDEGSPNHLYALQADGTAVAGFPVFLDGPVRCSPTICDLDLDGDVDVVLGSWDRKIHAWDLPFGFDPARVPWSTFRGNVGRDGLYQPPGGGPEPGPAPPAVLELAAPYPNPFNPATTVRLFLPGDPGQTVSLSLRVYDLQGRLVRTLFAGRTSPGWLSCRWDGCDRSGRRQASGVYFLRASTERAVVTRKMMLLR